MEGQKKNPPKKKAVTLNFRCILLRWMLLYFYRFKKEEKKQNNPIFLVIRSKAWGESDLSAGTLETVFSSKDQQGRQHISP